MAIDITIETHIARPPDAVFAALIDLDAWPSWLVATGIQAITRSADGPIAVGEPLTVEQRAAGRASVVDARITALVAPSRFAIGGHDADGVSTALEADLTPDGDGTRLRWSARIELPFRFRAFEGLARPQVERAAALDVEAFRRRLESPSAD